MIIKVPAEKYHQDAFGQEPSISNSFIKTMIKKSPLHAFMTHPRLNHNWEGEDESTKFSVGTGAHSVLLEGIDCLGVVDAKDWRTNAAKEARDAFFLECKTPVLAHQYDEIMLMAESANKQIASALGLDLMNDGDPEQTVLWTFDGVNCRARIDWLSKDKCVIVDYKTTDIATPKQFIKNVSVNGYDIQSAWYKSAIRNETGEVPRFIFAVQETEAPYSMYFVELSEAFNEIASMKIGKALATWKQCVASGVWPGYDNEVIYAEPMPWELAEAEEIKFEAEERGWSKEAFLFGRVRG